MSGNLKILKMKLFFYHHFISVGLIGCPLCKKNLLSKPLLILTGLDSYLIKILIEIALLIELCP